MSLRDFLVRLFRGDTATAVDPPRRTLLSALAAVTHGLRELGVSHAIIGGLALAAHNVVRATSDVDLLVDGARADDVHELMRGLGFESLRRTDDVANYLLAHQRVDVLFANRAYSKGMLAKAASSEISGISVPIARAEDLIALKLQALANDPTRDQDRTDIRSLVEYNRDNLDLELLREYFRLFEREAELDELLAAAE